MPINEHLARPSNLTPQQQREAMKEVYGLAEKEPMTPTTDLSYEERIALRRALDKLDQKEAGGMKTFDLNKPPVPPYVFREYPFLMYHHDLGTTRSARNYDERQRLLTEGWSEDPVPPAATEVELSAEERLEAQEIDNKLVKKRRA
jgi:hypothetical protein